MFNFLKRFIFSPTQKPNAHKGQASIDMVMMLITFLMMLGSCICISLYIYLYHTFITAAREGCRYAVTDSRMATVATQAAAITDTRTVINNFLLGSAGTTLSNSEITVGAPTGVIGNRTITVTVQHAYDMPIKPSQLMSAFAGGAPATDSLDHFTVSARVIMRYEE